MTLEGRGDPLLTAVGLTKHFPIVSPVLNHVVGEVKAVDGVDLAIWRGETLGLVGESGSGKSTLGRLLVRLIEPTAGTVTFNGEDITRLRRRALRRRRAQFAIIFQDPYASLDPRQTVSDMIGEALDIQHRAPGRREPRINELLELVGLNKSDAHRYPHEFSGGQRQRIGIARALAVEPTFIVCDEPISALDVSIQAQIINLLQRLQEELHLTYLFISHDLSVVRHISDRIAVMQLGSLIEEAPASDLYARPRHPYTASLLSAVPVPDPRIERRRRRIVLSGEVPSPLNPPSGCRFRTRCFQAQERCAEERPTLDAFAAGAHRAACFFALRDRDAAELGIQA